MAMTSPVVLLNVSNGLATLALNRPDQLNALTPSMGHDMALALDLAIEQGARALLLTGKGRAFCAGADIGGDSPVTALEDYGAPLEESYNELVLKLADYPIPIVTAINGPAVGAGASLAMLGDIIVMSSSAYLLLSFAKVGIVPDCGATWLAVRSAGLQRALEMMMLADKIPAAKALEWGLANRVVEDAALMEEAGSLARRLADGPTRAYGMIRKAARTAAQSSLADILQLERENQRAAGMTADARDAMAAFVEKRPPVFTGK
jgi:2-(1,2-epoxy-1,2-dihydrophenyl)acetyl-CoA isomerase